jgi:hypothetical protein
VLQIHPHPRARERAEPQAGSRVPESPQTRGVLGPRPRTHTSSAAGYSFLQFGATCVRGSAVTVSSPRSSFPLDKAGLFCGADQDRMARRVREETDHPDLEDGALMEQSGRKRWQAVANARGRERPKCGEPQSPPTRSKGSEPHGKEGVNGSFSNAPRRLEPFLELSAREDIDFARGTSVVLTTNNRGIASRSTAARPGALAPSGGSPTRRTWRPEA